MAQADVQGSIITPKKISLAAITMIALAASFYMYEFILQVSPAVMTTDLMQSLNIDAAGLGVISAFYYYAYTPMQIPAGLLYDRFGPRILLTIAVTVCACGALFFSLSHTFFTIALGRFGMGLGSAFAFIGALVITTRWLPPQYFAITAGIVQLMSSIGAIGGEAPLAAAVHHFGWRQTIFTVSMAGFALALLIWLVVRDSPVRQQQQARGVKNVSEAKRLWVVCKRAQTWWVGIYAFCSWAPVLAFSALWGVPFLVKLYGISVTEASGICSMIWIGIGLGSPLVGYWSERIEKRNMPLFICMVSGLIGLVSVLYVPHMPIALSYIALLMMGFAAAGQSLSFAVVRDINLPSHVGTAIGLNNMLVVAGGAIFQPLLGLILHLLWNGEIINGTPHYSLANYQVAMLILPFCYILGMIVSGLFLHETNCKHQTEISSVGTIEHN